MRILKGLVAVIPSIIVALLMWVVLVIGVTVLALAIPVMGARECYKQNRWIGNLDLVREKK